MAGALDERYVDEFKTLKINQKGSGFLYVQLEEWVNLLYKLERRNNFGCLFYGFAVFTSFILFKIQLASLLFALIFLGMIYKFLEMRRFKNLQYWGLYQFEVYDDRIVRYTDSKYEKYPFEDFTGIAFKGFGLILTKKRKVTNFLLSPNNLEVFVIPKRMQGYEQVVEYIASINKDQSSRI